MSADFNDSILEGNVKIKSRHVGTWNKRWIILKKSSSNGPKRIEKFTSKNKSLLAGSTFKTIFLDELINIQLAENDAKRCTLSLRSCDKTERLFAFDSEEEATEWLAELKRLMARQDSFTNTIDVMFNVYMLPNPNLSFYGESLLQVSNTHIILYDVHDTRKILVSWPITGLRRFGKDDTKFTLEAGSKCDTGEGLFSFNSKESEKIHSKVYKASKAIVATYRHRQNSQSSNDGSTVSSFSDTPEPSQPHERIQHSRSFPSDSRPPMPPPRASPTLPRSRSSGGATSNGSAPRGALASPDGTVPPPLPPMRPARTALPNNNHNNPSQGEEDLYEERYLEPGFKQYLSERKQ